MRVRHDARQAIDASSRKDEILRALMNDIVNKRLFIRTAAGMLVAVTEVSGVYDPKEIARLLKIGDEEFNAMLAALSVSPEPQDVADTAEATGDNLNGGVDTVAKFILHEVGQ